MPLNQTGQQDAQGVYDSDITSFGSNAVVTGVGASGLGVPRVTIANDSNALVRPSDGTNVITVKAASTAPVATDTAEVVALSPNGNQATAALQTTGNTSLASIQSTSNSTATNTAGIEANQTNGNQRTLVTDLVGNLQPAGATPATTIFVRLNDGTSSTSVFNGQLNTDDILNTAAQYRAQSVTTTAALALGAASALANRKHLHITPTNGTIYWGYSSAVTTASGTPLFTNQTRDLTVGPNVTVYVISAGTVDARIAELS